MDNFIAREIIKHFRHELENGVDEPTRATMLKLLLEEENRFGHILEELNRLDRHIARLSEIMARQVELMDRLQSMGSPLRRAPVVLATLRAVMATYLEDRQRITASLGDAQAREA